MSLNQGDRVVLLMDFTSRDTNIPGGTVGTVVAFISDESCLVRYGYDEKNDREIMAGIPAACLRKANDEDLIDVNYQNLVSKLLHQEAKYVMGKRVQYKDVRPGDVGIIWGVSLKTNEMNDVLKVNFKDKGFLELTRAFLETYSDPYIEELGDEISLSGEKNYHLINARMFLVEKYREEFGPTAVIMDRAYEPGYDDEEWFTVECANGQFEDFDKSELIPITNREELYTYPAELLIRNKYSIGKTFKAKSNVENHMMLKDHFKENDVVKVIHIDSIACNALEDTVAIQRTGGELVVVSTYELDEYFEQYTGMIKKAVTGQVRQIEVKTTENIEDNINNKPSMEIIIVSNGVSFTSLDEGYTFFISEDLNKHTIDNIINGLQELRKFMKRS